MFMSENLQEKWQPVLSHPDLPEISDPYKKAVTSVVLENQERAFNEENGILSEDAPINNAGGAVGGTGVDNWNPILISLVRRSLPNLIAYDICGVQPMTGPTGLVFCMKARYNDNTSRLAMTEALFDASRISSGGRANGSRMRLQSFPGGKQLL